MSPAADEADRRIAARELELARMQSEAAYRQLESNLVRDALKRTLETAAVFARTAAVALDANIARMADDLNGGGHDDLAD